MRLRALTNYNFMSLKRPILFFCIFYTLGMTLASVLTTIGMGTFGSTVTNDAGEIEAFSASIISFGIFMFIYMLILSQSNTRFLITRSVTRKEIYTSSLIFMLPLAAVMSVLQILEILFDGAVRSLISGTAYRGLMLDAQSIQAPGMENAFVFFLVSFAMLLVFGAIGYMLGSFMAKWKVLTVGGLILIGLIFFGSLASPPLADGIFNAFKFFYYDTTSAFYIILKQIILALALMLIAYPVMRRITAGKLSGA